MSKSSSRAIEDKLSGADVSAFIAGIESGEEDLALNTGFSEGFDGVLGPPARRCDNRTLATRFVRLGFRGRGITSARPCKGKRTANLAEFSRDGDARGVVEATLGGRPCWGLATQSFSLNSEGEWLEVDRQSSKFRT